MTSCSIRLTWKSFLSFDIKTCTNVSGADAPAVNPIFGDSKASSLFRNSSKVFSSGINLAIFTPLANATSTNLREFEEFSAPITRIESQSLAIDLTACCLLVVA